MFFRRTVKNKNAGLLKVLDAAGGVMALARMLNLNHAVVSRWHQVPAHWIIEIENKTGVPREQIRPELYRR
jgi:hypothetical protein